MTGTEQGPNHDLFVQVFAQIEKHPKSWKQSTFADTGVCGTSHCFAGWAIAFSGLVATEDERATDLSGIDVGDAGQVAEDLLGMPVGPWVNGYENEHLFDPGNDLADLYRISADLLGIDEAVLRDKVRSEVSA